MTATSDTGLLPEGYIPSATIPRLNLLPKLPIGVGVGIKGLIKPGLLLVSHGRIHHGSIGESEGACQVPVVLDSLRGESVVAREIYDVVLGSRRRDQAQTHIS
jgi:hypothetical protein